MLSEEIDRSLGCRNCMKRVMQVLSESAKASDEIPWDLSVLVHRLNVLSDTVLPGGTTKPSKYNRISWHDREKISGIWLSRSCNWLM